MTTTKQSWIKRSMAVLLAVIMVMSMGVANVFAAGTDEVSIPDANLKAAINRQLAKQTGSQRADDAAVTEDDMASLTELVAESAGITDLTGLEKAVNLETLDLSGNDLNDDFASSSPIISNWNFNTLRTVRLSNVHLSDSLFLMNKLSTSANLETIDLSDNNLIGTFSMRGVKTTWAALKKVDLSNNNLNGISLSVVFDFPALEIIDLKNNRIWPSENAGDWYVNVVEVGTDRFDFSEQKSLTDLRAVYVQDVSSDFNTSFVNTETKEIDLGATLNESLTFKLQGYGAAQTMSGNLNNAAMPVMIAGPETNATATDNCLFTVELSPGENLFTLELTHASGEFDTYTVRVTRNNVPSDSSDGSADIQDAALQIAICEALNSLDEYESNPIDSSTHIVTKEDMGKITKLDVENVTDISGLEYAVNLTSLELRGTYTGVVDVSKFTKLKTLRLEGNYSNITGLSELSNLKTLEIQNANDNITGYENLTSLTSLTLRGTFNEIPEIDLLTNLTTLTVDIPENNDLSSLSVLGKLKTLNIYKYNSEVIWPEKLQSLTRLMLYDCAEENISLPGIVSDKTVTYTVKTQKGADVNLNISGLDSIETDTKVSFSPVSINAANTLQISGSAKSVISLEVEYTDNLKFASDFSVENLTSLTIANVSNLLEFPQSNIGSIGTLSLKNVSFKNGEFPEEINNFSALKKLTIYSSNLTDFNSMDLSGCDNLASISIYMNEHLQDSLDATKLPSSIEELVLYNNRIITLTGDWSKMSALTSINLKNNYMTDFPSTAISQISTLESLWINGNIYSTIAADTFDNSKNLRLLMLGDFLPVVQEGNVWVADPNRDEGKAIAKLQEVSPSVRITYSNGLFPSGSYSGLVSIDSNLGSISGTVFTEKEFTMLVPIGNKTITLTPRALLDDTVIEINGEKYQSGDNVTVDLTGLNTTVTITCYNDYVNETYLPQETTYKLTIITGEYIQDFKPDEGKTYNIEMRLAKADDSTSMANAYFNHNATVRYKDGTYEIRFTTIMPSYITDMLYKYNNTDKQADIIGGDGITTREYRIYADSLDQPITITPRVAPMGNQYTSCYMKLDLTKVIDITDSIESDTADLNAAINKAVAITEKRNVYTDASWKNFIEKLEAAQEIAENDTVAQDIVDNAAKELEISMTVGGEGGLVIDESKLANKTALETAINEAKALQQGNHTATAWNALQEAIADAQAVYDTLEASQTEVDTAAKSLNTAVTLFQNSGEASELDKNNLEDGVYSVYGEMIKTNREEKSMSNDAINHYIKLTVEDGKYYLNMDFHGLAYLNKFGYLAELSYYDNGYTYGQYGTVEGTRIAADVLSTQKNADGSDLYDEFNQAGGSYEGKLYPDQIQFPLVADALADEEGYVPLHVFVPVMEDISAGTGDQDVLLKLDWSTLTKTTEDDPNFEPEESVEQSPAVDFIDSATGVKVQADKGVFDEGVQIVVSGITQGADYDAAASSLSDVGKKFKLYDVKFLDAEGNEVTPNGTVSISLPITAGYDSTNLAVYRLADSGKVLVRGAVENGYYTVITRTAGTYALVEKGSTITDAENTENADNGNQNQNDNTTSPQTGDSSNVAVYALLALAAAGMMGVTLVTRKRKSEEA